MFGVTHRVLPNGLRLIMIRLPHTHSVTHAFFTRTGPRYETPQENGISHLVEHLVFRGTASHPSSYSFNAAVEALGGEVNGLTQRDATAIHITVPPRHAAIGLGLLGQMCTEPLLSGLEIERRVVVEEILETLDADGQELDIDTISRLALWPSHPLAQAVAGKVNIVEQLSDTQCRKRFDESFVASNGVLVTAGAFDEAEIIEAASMAFLSMPKGQRHEEPPAPCPAARKPIHIQPSDDSQVTVLVTFPAPHENHPDFGALLLLKRVLDDGFASRLRQSICEQRGLAYSVSASIDAYRDAGTFDVELTCAPHKVVEAVEQILETLRETTETEVGYEELERAKARHLAETEYDLDNPAELASWFGTSALLDCPVSYSARIGEVLAIRGSDLHKLCRSLFTKEAALLTLVGPMEESDAEKLEILLGRDPSTTVFLGEEEDEPKPLALAL